MKESQREAGEPSIGVFFADASLAMPLTLWMARSRDETEPSRGVARRASQFFLKLRNVRGETRTAKRDDFASTSRLATCTIGHYHSAMYTGLRERDSLQRQPVDKYSEGCMKCDSSRRRQRLTMFFHGG